MKKLKNFDGIFLKFISCVRRIVLKWFQDDSASLNVRKVKDKKNVTWICPLNVDFALIKKNIAIYTRFFLKFLENSI